MSEEEIKPDGFIENDMVQIIDSGLQTLATLADISDSTTYDDETEDRNTVKRNTYRIIFAAQRKLLKMIKDG